MGRNNARKNQDAQTDQVFIFPTMQCKLLCKYHQVKIDMNQTKNTPAQYLAKPISYVSITHVTNLNDKIVKIRYVFTNGEMMLWEVGLITGSNGDTVFTFWVIIKGFACTISFKRAKSLFLPVCN